MLAWTRSRSSSLVANSLGNNLRFLNHLLRSVFVQVLGSPVGSGSAGNMSPPQITQAVAAVTMPANAKNAPLDCVTRSNGVGMFEDLVCDQSRV